MKKKPVNTFRDGGLEAAVWKNSETFYSVTVSRSYKDKEGVWQRNANFGYEELPRVLTLLQDAQQYIANVRGLEGVKAALDGDYEAQTRD